MATVRRAPNSAATCAARVRSISDLVVTKLHHAARTFYPQLLFPPRTLNNFQRHPCHEVVVITVNFGPEKAGVGGSTPSLASIAQIPGCGIGVNKRLWFGDMGLDWLDN